MKCKQKIISSVKPVMKIILLCKKVMNKKFSRLKIPKLRILTLIAIFFFIWGISSVLNSRVFMKTEEAMKIAFPNATSFKKINVYLDQNQLKAVISKCACSVDSRLFVFYKAMQSEKILGYLSFDTHILRTSTETIMAVFLPDGTIQSVEILAFYEPMDYFPTSAWMKQFKNQESSAELIIGKDLKNITGATISSRKLSEAVRKLRAVFSTGVMKK